MGVWGLDALRDELARRGLRLAHVRGRWRLYRGGRQVACARTADAMRRLIRETMLGK